MRTLTDSFSRYVNSVRITNTPLHGPAGPAAVRPRLRRAKAASLAQKVTSARQRAASAAAKAASIENATFVLLSAQPARYELSSQGSRTLLGSTDTSTYKGIKGVSQQIFEYLFTPRSFVALFAEVANSKKSTPLALHPQLRIALAQALLPAGTPAPLSLTTPPALTRNYSRIAAQVLLRHTGRPAQLRGSDARYLHLSWDTLGQAWGTFANNLDALFARVESLLGTAETHGAVFDLDHPAAHFPLTLQASVTLTLEGEGTPLLHLNQVLAKSYPAYEAVS